jgi:hypothetical protein
MIPAHEVRRPTITGSKSSRGENSFPRGFIAITQVQVITDEVRNGDKDRLRN